ncbi:MAG: hypothetical protein QOJ57_1780 [Thermoleophilaceae bacterium]|nr:hypothetical protein [Thermoleophilaceae bacterium]
MPVLRRVVPLLALLALLASGCGSKSSGSGLDSALQYVPKGAPVVVAIDTDPAGDQWQQVDKLIGKFPFGGQVKQQFKSAFNARAGIDWDKDVKPLLGNDLVVAVTAASGPGTGTPFVAAWKVKDEATAKRLVEKNSSKIAPIEGADVYRTQSGNLTAFKDGTLVSARSEADMTAALKRAGSGDHMTEQDFTDALGDLDDGALVRITGNLQALLADPSAAAARKVKWVSALRTFGFTMAAQSDGIELAFDVKTEGALQDSDLPLAAGSDSAPVVRRAGEVGIGLRNPAQIVTFAQTAAQLTDPAGYAKFKRKKATLAKQLGINIDRDVIGQFTGNSAVSVALNGDFAVRADLRDPAAAEATLKKAAPRLVKAAKGKSLGLSTPKNGKGFYALAQANGKKVVFGVVGKTFVAATDAARAAQFAGQSPSIVSGAKGALVLASDARALANAIATRQGQGTAGQILTGALGDLIGSVESDASGLTGKLKLFIK